MSSQCFPYDIDRKVRKCALQLEDTFLPSKLAPGDMIALEAKYHGRCLVELYNRARKARATHVGSEDHDDFHSIAFGIHRRFSNGRGCWPSLQIS